MSLVLLATQPDPIVVGAAAATVSPDRASLSPGRAIALHWREYVMEASELAFFMISACLFGAAYENPASPVRQALASPLLREC